MLLFDSLAGRKVFFFPSHVCHLRDSEWNANMVIAHQTLGSKPTPANVGEYPKRSLSGGFSAFILERNVLVVRSFYSKQSQSPM